MQAALQDASFIMLSAPCKQARLLVINGSCMVGDVASTGILSVCPYYSDKM
jgi:hypothetical protein